MRLINSAKLKLGKVSKLIIEKINNNLISELYISIDGKALIQLSMVY